MDEACIRSRANLEGEPPTPTASPLPALLRKRLTPPESKPLAGTKNSAANCRISLTYNRTLVTERRDSAPPALAQEGAVARQGRTFPIIFWHHCRPRTVICCDRISGRKISPSARFCSALRNRFIAFTSPRLELSRSAPARRRSRRGHFIDTIPPHVLTAGFAPRVPQSP